MPLNSRACCGVCGEEASVFLSRGKTPVHQNLIVRSPEAARQMTRGDLEMAVCSSCGFVFNTAFNPDLLSYGQAYDNTQSWSPAFEAYLDELVHDLIVHKGVTGCRIVEVGCGKGLFLRKLVTEGSGNTGVGFDPSYEGPSELLDGRLSFRRQFYDESCADVRADVVICRHVIEHVPDPRSLLVTVREALRLSPGARLFFETPCVEWILRNQVIWDFFYEHCSLFTRDSLRTTFELSSLQVDDVRHVFDGQYLWLEGHVGEDSRLITSGADSMVAAAYAYAEAERALVSAWRETIATLRADGGVALWGAGAKGVTFANLIDPEASEIACVIDLNPQKQGGFVPGTAHPIVSYKELPTYGVRSAILMNPNYEAENRQMLQEAGISLNLIVRHQ
jgi:SAM-dependent methyltransferase